MNKIIPNNQAVYIGPELYTAEVINWLKENTPVHHLLANNEIGGEIWFENSPDAVAFKLRWL